MARRLRTKKNDAPSMLNKLRQARLDKVHEQVIKLRIENKKSQAEVLPVVELWAAVEKANRVVKSRLLAIPTRVAVQLAGVDEPGEVAQLLRYEIETALNDLAEHGREYAEEVVLN